MKLDPYLNSHTERGKEKGTYLYLLALPLCIHFPKLSSLNPEIQSNMKRILFPLVIVLFCWACESPEHGHDNDSDHGHSHDAPAAEMLYESGQEPEQKLKDLGVELYEPIKPIANYVTAVRTGNQVWLSGHGPVQPDGELVRGKVGVDLTIEEGQQAARYTAVALLTSLKAEIGDLNKVKRIIKVGGMVNCSTDFTEQPKVVNGCSDLLVAVFGKRGKHTRAAVGMGSLPGNIPIEIDMVVEVVD